MPTVGVGVGVYVCVAVAVGIGELVDVGGGVNVNVNVGDEVGGGAVASTSNLATNASVHPSQGSSPPPKSMKFLKSPARRPITICRSFPFSMSR